MRIINKKNFYKVLVFSFMIFFISSCYLNRNIGDNVFLEDNSNKSAYESANRHNYFISGEIDSLYKLIEFKDLQMDSLFSLLDSYIFLVDSLRQEIEITSSKILINDSFEIPTRYSFAGVEFDLTNDRIRTRLKNIFDIEVRKAHQFIPRSGIYFALMDSILAEHNIHPDVKYLAVAESNLNYMAYSQAHAAGIWQFIPATARGFNLKIDNYVDERRNIFKSTHAACRYLNNAHSQLNAIDVDDWLLTLASYNTGVGNVRRSIREQNGRDFFSLIMRFDETNNYVWRAIATKIIFEFEEEIFEKRFERYTPLLETARLVELNLNGFYDIAEWASAYGTTAGQIWELNPWIKLSQRRVGSYSRINHLILPPGKYEILVPIEAQPDSIQIATIEKKFQIKNNSPFLIPGQTITHKVVRGETLIGLARRYGVKVDDIKKWNNLNSNTIYIGQTLRLQGRDQATATSTKSGQYKVQSGDTLAAIAQKLGVSQNHLIQKNNLKTVQRNNLTIVMIQPGQVLEY